MLDPLNSLVNRDFIMSEILLCSQPLGPQTLQNECNINFEDLTTIGCSKHNIAAPNIPYLIGKDDIGFTHSLLNQLSSAPVAEDLTRLSTTFGGDEVVALSEITKKLQDYNVGLLGATTSVYATRMDGFVGSVKSYQSALMNYRHAVRSHSPLKAGLKQKVVIAYEKMQRQFHNELQAVTAQVKSRHGTPLTNPQRGINIARSSRKAAKLNLTSGVQAQNLVRFTKSAKLLGNGLAVIDFGSRVGNIHNSYKAGGDWERDMFIESSSSLQEPSLEPLRLMLVPQFYICLWQ
jgi:hypothetical protein